MSGIKDFLSQMEDYDTKIKLINGLKEDLQTEGYTNYRLIKATVNYFTISERGQKDLVVFFEVPGEFIDDCAFVEAYSMKGIKHLIVVHQKDNMSIEVANQTVHSDLIEEPYINNFRYITKDKVIVCEYYNDKFLRDPYHYYLLRLDSKKKDFVEKSKLNLAEYMELYQRSYESLEELNKGPKRELAKEEE